MPRPFKSRSSYTCYKCGESIVPGQLIIWHTQKRGEAAHADHFVKHAGPGKALEQKRTILKYFKQAKERFQDKYVQGDEIRPIQDVSEDEYLGLTKRQRNLLKRVGYYYLPVIDEPNTNTFMDFYDRSLREARMLSYEMVILRRIPFPVHIGLEDLVQEALLHLWIKSASTGMPVRSWRIRTMKNRMLNVRRAGQVEKRSCLMTYSVDFDNPIDCRISGRCGTNIGPG
jgi:Sigma-70 region 2